MFHHISVSLAHSSSACGPLNKSTRLSKYSCTLNGPSTSSQVGAELKTLRICHGGQQVAHINEEELTRTHM